MKVQERLDILAGAVRNQLRKMGCNPRQAEEQDILEVIDEFAFAFTRGDKRVVAEVAAELGELCGKAYRRRLNQIVKMVRGE